MTYDPADTIATVVNWYGPYTGRTSSDVIDNARKAALAFKGTWPGLYMAIGSGEKVRTGPRKPLYIGIAKLLENRLKRDHEKLSQLNLGSIWLGEIGVHELVGAQRKKLNIHLDLVEWASAFFLELPHNVKKRQNPPDRSCVVINRWWGTDYSSFADRPHAKWPDIIDYSEPRESALLVGYGGSGSVREKLVSKVKRISASTKPEFEEEEAHS